RALRREQLVDLPHRVVDLHVELALAEFGARAPSVAGDAVVDPRRSVRIGLAASAASLSRLGRRIADRGLDEIFSDPALVAAEVQHLRRIRDARMRAARVAVLGEPLVEIILPLPVHLVAVDDADALRRIL